ncbi:non-ribosomal peptide synthetase [Actinophytocola oryzae]|nr:non-ribosomal peptide synthetase [Actinophytocola oryzae]
MTTGTAAVEGAFAGTDGDDLFSGRPVHRIFAERAARHPDAVAVRAGATSMTYAELDDRANRLAHLLRDRGVGHETAVALCLDRGPWLPVAVLAVFRAGGTYVPLDPNDPPARRDLVIDDADAALVLTDGPVEVSGVDVLDLGSAALDAAPAHAPDVADDPRRAAYVIYTSGSTGRPKGVVVEHRNLTAYVDGVVRRLAIDRPMRFAMVQPLTVDSSVTALFPPLCTGGEVHLLRRETVLDPGRFADWVGEHGMDVLKIAPSHLRALQSSPRFEELLPQARLVVGGEAADWRWLQALQRARPHCRVVNHYGPTETTVGVLTLAVADHPDADWDIAPIGGPLPGVRVSVVDVHGDPVADGEIGELVVAGPYVARGYHRRPELTATAFALGRYRTGDQVRRLADGTIAFVGRQDDQVKVNGFRVELGEVDAALRAHPAVHASATVVRDLSGERAIVSYAQTGATPDELLTHLRARLAPHQVPRAVVVLDRIPLSAHGKVDRAALPVPPEPAEGAAAATDLERTVSSAWSAVLGVDSVAADVNFFDAGGHSLLLVQLQQRLRDGTGQPVDLIDLLAHTTVQAQARLLSGRHPGLATAPAGRRTPQQDALLRRRVQHSRTIRDAR